MKRLVILFVILTSVTFAQMVPHPRLLEKLKANQDQSGVVAKYFKNRAKSIERGIDAPWTAFELTAKRSSGIQSGQFQRMYGPSKTPTGSWNALVLFVKFSDKSSQVNTSTFDNLLYGAGAGSMRDYYTKISYGNLDIVTANLPSTLTWVTAAQPYSYYVGTDNGTGTYPNNAQKLVEEVVQMVNPTIDFSKYDNDKDGYVDGLFIVHTGPGAEYTGSANDIWSHAWQTNTDQLVDGVKVSNYSMEPEYWVTPGDMTMGVFAHELAHAAFGLPDVYDTDYTSSGLGNWSLMAGGSWNGTGEGGNYPAFPDAWNHAQMGFITPTVINANTIGVQIPQIETNAKAYLLWKGGVFSKEYFLIENRQQTGYDQYLPGSGLLVYHIDENQTSNDNEWYPGKDITKHYLTALEQADGLWHLEKSTNEGDDADPFPGSGNKTQFTNTTTPSTKDYTNTATLTSIKNISASSAIMTADFETVSTDISIEVASPNGGEIYQVNTSHSIVWNSLNVANVKIEYSLDNGTNWNTIIASIAANAGSYSWTVPNVTSNQCKVRVSDASNASYFDESNAVFTIQVNAPPTALFEENFDYTSGDLLSAHNWLVSGTPPSTINPMTITSPGLTFTNYPSNLGNSAFINNTGQDLYKSFNPVISGSVYISFLMNVKTAQIGDYFLALSPSTGQTLYYARTHIKSSGAGYLLGISKNSELSGGKVYGTTLLNFNTTYLVVVKHTFTANDMNDEEKVFVFPTTIPSTEPSTPEIGPFVETTKADPADLSFITLRQGSATNSSTLTIDGIRIATSWENLFGTSNNTPSIVVTSPNGGEVWNVNSSHNITWTSTNVTNVKIEYTSDNGTNWNTIVASTAASAASYSWTVPSTTSSLYKVRISDATNALVNDLSDNVFSVALASSITVISPNGGESWVVGSSRNITWTSTNVTNVKIEYTSDNGTNWNTIIASTAASATSYNWTVPNNVSAQYKIRISDASNASLNDISDNVFSVLQFTWIFDITINDKDNGANKTLTYGTASTATDGLDASLGELALPPFPPTGVFDSRFTLPTAPIDYSLKDFRKDGQDKITWIINFQPGANGYPMTFTWDKTKFPEGSFTLKDLFSGSIVNVNMKLDGSYTLTNGAIKSLAIEYSKQLCLNVDLLNGWNLFSVPVNALNMNTQSLFPDYSSPTYGYNNGYQSVTDLVNGAGYWVRYSAAKTVNVCGSIVNSNTVNVKSGWNLVGIYGLDVNVADITVAPGIINSQFYEYANGYIIPVKLKPGKGYWVRVSENGVLNFGAAGSPSNSVLAKVNNSANVNYDASLNITDAIGNNNILRLSKDIANIDEFDLPPVPPKGIFEARFSSDRKVEKLDGSTKQIILNSANYPITIFVEGSDLLIKDIVGGKIVNAVVGKGKSITISNPIVSQLEISAVQIPISYQLMQNYPNPFNPTTVIKYQIPQNSRVTLKIFDMLGRELERLVDEQKEAGSYQIEWNAAKYSSGVYFYHIQTEKFNSVKKMLLIK